MIIPSSLLVHLRDLVPHFAEESLRDQMSLSQMLWMSTQIRRRHSEWGSAISISKDDIRKMWGSDKRMREVVGVRYFRVLRGSNLGAGFTHGAGRHHRDRGGVRGGGEGGGRDLALAGCPGRRSGAARHEPPAVWRSTSVQDSSATLLDHGAGA